MSSLVFRQQLNLFKHILQDLEGLAASDGPEVQDVFAAFELQKAWVQLQLMISAVQEAAPAMSSGGPSSVERRRAVGRCEL